jgi:hypothetical protein
LEIIRDLNNATATDSGFVSGTCGGGGERDILEVSPLVDTFAKQMWP